MLYMYFSLYLILQLFFLGVVWPIEGQPKLLRKISELIPLQILGQTVDGIRLKGWTLDHPSILFGITASFVYTILLVLILVVLGKYKKNLWVIHK